MPHHHFKSLSTSCLLAAGLTMTSSLAGTPLPQTQDVPNQKAGSIALPPATKQASSPKAAAYYHFAPGHLYEESSSTYGNKSDYVIKAIENFRLAMKEDPSASFLVEDIAGLYSVSGRIRDAVEEAQ